jgi:HlyD family secretion protein
LSKRVQNIPATKRQVDEVEGKVNVLQEQIKSVETQDAPIKRSQID